MQLRILIALLLACSGLKAQQVVHVSVDTLDVVRSQVEVLRDSVGLLSDSITALQVEVRSEVVDVSNPVFYKAAGSVLSNGTVEQGAGATVSRVSQGIYQITFSSAAPSNTYPVLATMQGLPANDDYQWAYLSRTTNGFRIEVREQDNGGTAGVLRDSGFSFFVPKI